MFIAAIHCGVQPSEFWLMSADDFWLLLRSKKPELFKMQAHDRLVKLIEERKAALKKEGWSSVN